MKIDDILLESQILAKGIYFAQDSTAGLVGFDPVEHVLSPKPNEILFYMLSVVLKVFFEYISFQKMFDKVSS